MAGIWARNDDTRGVHKAPANEVVRGAISLELQHHQGRARPAEPGRASTASGRSPGQGIRVWGARTLSSDPEWRYLNVRRLFNFVEESILTGTNWVVFEPERPEAVGLGASAPSRCSCAGSGATARCSARTPARRSSSSATRRTTRPRTDRRRHLDRRDRHRPGEAGRVRRLPHQPVLRRRRTRGMRSLDQCQLVW